MADMIRKFCGCVGGETWHNPLKLREKQSQEWRCVRCGKPAGTHIVGSGGELCAIVPVPVPGNPALKAKYRIPGRFIYRKGIEDIYNVPAPGTAVYKAGKFSAKTMNKGTKSNVKTLKPRRRAYGPW